MSQNTRGLCRDARTFVTTSHEPLETPRGLGRPARPSHTPPHDPWGPGGSPAYGPPPAPRRTALRAQQGLDRLVRARRELDAFDVEAQAEPDHALAGLERERDLRERP